jgi:Protein of unknown function (DUF3999)
VKLLAAVALFAAVATSPEIRYFRYTRPVENTPRQAAQTCVSLDAGLFAHAAPGLADLRLYRDRDENPYLVQTSFAATTANAQSVEALNLGLRGGETVFDAAMPSATYRDLSLHVNGRDFIATVTVTGSQQQSGPATRIGSLTIFDLTHQKLGRSTVLHLPPSDFRYLHFRVAGPLRPEDITGLAVERGSGSEPASFINIAESTRVTSKGSSSIIEFTVPAHVPVERIQFVPATTPANFSRDVLVEAKPVTRAGANDSAVPPPVISRGNLLRVHTVQDDHHIDQEQLAIEPLRTTFDAPSLWTVTIDNGDDAPLVPSSVRLQMIERSLCFEASGGPYALFYGDPSLSAPRYDLGQFLVIHVNQAARGTIAPEQPNPEYQLRPDTRPFTERHPALLWIALGLVVLLLGAIALRTAKTTRSQPG